MSHSGFDSPLRGVYDLDDQSALFRCNGMVQSIHARLSSCESILTQQTPPPQPGILLKWLTPGIGVKRWVLILLAGAVLLGLSLAALIVELYRTNPSLLWSHLLQLFRIPLWLAGGLAFFAGIALVLISVIRINMAILRPLDLEGSAVITAMMDHRRGQRGPKIVAVGGGTGTSTLLRGLKAHTSNLTAVVTVADDGGSSGRLRRDLGVLPPGDFRNNIAALARDEGLMAQLFQYRFGEGGLEGHSFGNLFITAMSAITGSFEQALIESSRVLNIRGKVLPSTLADITLMANLRESQASTTRRVVGESAIPEVVGIIEQVFLQPDDAPAYPGSVQAILSADLIVLGPGSLFTSILPNLLVPGVAQAIRSSKALKVYVCNVATQHGETENFTVTDHIRAIERHVGSGLFDIVLVNSQFPKLAPDANFQYVQVGEVGENGTGATFRVQGAPLVDGRRPWRHSSERLAQAILRILEESGRYTPE